jgi:hypothetical protein
MHALFVPLCAAEHHVWAAYQGYWDTGGIWEDELDFLKLASSSPVLCQKDPTTYQHIRVRKKIRRVPASPAIAEAMSHDNRSGVALQGRNSQNLGHGEVEVV